jgi:hypothetical protein
MEKLRISWLGYMIHTALPATFNVMFTPSILGRVLRLAATQGDGGYIAYCNPRVLQLFTLHAVHH